jgi:hypothetical protein
MPQVLAITDRSCPVLRPLQRRAIQLLRDSSPAVRAGLLPALGQLVASCRDEEKPAGRWGAAPGQAVL